MARSISTQYLLIDYIQYSKINPASHSMMFWFAVHAVAAGHVLPPHKSLSLQPVFLFLFLSLSLFLHRDFLFSPPFHHGLRKITHLSSGMHILPSILC